MHRPPLNQQKQQRRKAANAGKQLTPESATKNEMDACFESLSGDVTELAQISDATTEHDSSMQYRGCQLEGAGDPDLGC